MGTINQGWGVCGFTSTFYAMFAQNKGRRPELNNANRAFNVLAEIKTYLMLLKAENSQLLGDITRFTQSFGGTFATFDIDAYITKINGSVGMSEATIMADSGFGIAMPPLAVKDYIERMWGAKATISQMMANSPPAGNGIVGVTRGLYAGGATLPLPHDGLRHWMYQHAGKIFSWGQVFADVASADSQGVWTVCVFIKVDA
ncbi:hypothetical protein ACVFYP_20790 [Roseomonas sp. F4]